MTRTDTTEQQVAEWQALEERAAHVGTTRALSPLEHEWLDDYRTHFAPMQNKSSMPVDIPERRKHIR